MWRAGYGPLTPLLWFGLMPSPLPFLPPPSSRAALASKVKGKPFKYFPRRETNRIKHKRYGTVSMTNDGNDM